MMVKGGQEEAGRGRRARPRACARSGGRAGPVGQSEGDDVPSRSGFGAMRTGLLPGFCGATSDGRSVADLQTERSPPPGEVSRHRQKTTVWHGKFPMKPLFDEKSAGSSGITEMRLRSQRQQHRPCALQLSESGGLRGLSPAHGERSRVPGRLRPGAAQPQHPQLRAQLSAARSRMKPSEFAAEAVG
jgi:hypothetical protein